MVSNDLSVLKGESNKEARSTWTYHFLELGPRELGWSPEASWEEWESSEKNGEEKILCAFHPQVQKCEERSGKVTGDLSEDCEKPERTQNTWKVQPWLPHGIFES